MVLFIEGWCFSPRGGGVHLARWWYFLLRGGAFHREVVVRI